MGLLYLDLDGFKLVNADFARPSRRRRAALPDDAAPERAPPRGWTCLGRQGGDEFLLLLADMPRADARGPRAPRAPPRTCRARWPSRSRSPARVPHRRVDRDLALPARCRRRRCAAAPRRRRDVRRQVRRANGVTVYSGDPHESLERCSIDDQPPAQGTGPRRAAAALAADRRPARRTLRKLEALVRWQDPFRGLVMPDEFIALRRGDGLRGPGGRLGGAVGVRDQVLAWERAGYRPPR